MTEEDTRQAAIAETALAYALTQEQAAELVDAYTAAVAQRVKHGADVAQPEGLGL